jgi:hypothetical protein
MADPNQVLVANLIEALQQLQHFLFWAWSFRFGASLRVERLLKTA